MKVYTNQEPGLWQRTREKSLPTSLQSKTERAESLLHQVHDDEGLADLRAARKAAEQGASERLRSKVALAVGAASGIAA
ncbi:MAG: hypothetical protein AB1758_11935, partial [Candidatus Eremiobacterota bacterium]